MTNEQEDINESFIGEVLQSYRPPGNPPVPKAVDWVRNCDGSVLFDHKGQPVSIDKILATKPLRGELCSRPGPGNKKLTYLSGEGVTRTLNDIFGFDGWNLEIKNTNREECIKDDKGRFHVAYTATVRLSHRKSGAYKEDCGAGDSIDRNMGTAIAHAMKSSITDAMKRAARHFGEKLGNSLYQGSFTINKAPMTLKAALDQYDIDRANTKFGFPKKNSATTNKTEVKTEPKAGSTAAVSNPSPSRVHAQPSKPVVPAKKSPASNVYRKSVPSQPVHHSAQKAMPAMPPPPIATNHQQPLQTHQQLPHQTPKSGPSSCMPMVTPNAAAQPPPTPGQRLQSGQLFGLGMFAAGSSPPEDNMENQPPQRPGTSTGMRGPFAGRSEKRVATETLAGGPLKKVAAQRNPYV